MGREKLTRARIGRGRTIGDRVGIGGRARQAELSGRLMARCWLWRGRQADFDGSGSQASTATGVDGSGAGASTERGLDRGM
jgi:hypothetical protein